MGPIKNLPTIHKNTLNLGLVSFFMNFSTGIVISNAISSINHDDGTGLYLFTITKILGDCLGYIGKVFIGFQSDLTQKRRRFLLYGYGAVLIIKPMFAMSCISYFSGYTQLLFFCAANIFDKLFNSLRDIPRDALIVDYTDQENLRENLTFRRALSFLGTVFGGIFTFFYLKKFNSIFLLYIFALIPAIIAVFILGLKVFDVKKNNTDLQKKKIYFLDLLNHIFLLNPKKIFLFFCFALLFLTFSFRMNETLIFEKAISLGLSEKNGGLCFSIFYFICFCNSLLLSTLKRYSSFYILAFILTGILCANLFLLYKLSIITLIFCGFIYAFNTNIIEGLMTASVIKQYGQTIWKGFLISIINIFIAISLFVNTIWLKVAFQHLTINKIIYFSIPPTFLAIILSLFMKKYYDQDVS